MGQYSRESDYSKQIYLNMLRRDFQCPCCGKSIPLSDAVLEKFELERELVYRPKVGYKVKYCGYRVCPRCEKKRNFAITFPIRFTKIYVLLAVVTSIIACGINLDKYGTVTIGAWLGFATPILVLVWLLPTLLLYKITKKLDFDKCLDKNAVDWNPNFTDNKNLKD